MIFKSILNEKYNVLRFIFKKTMNLAFNNQTHDGDMLLLCENAAYVDDMEQWDNSDPYMIGPQLQGQAERMHYDYIGNYVKQASALPYSDYLQMVQYNPINAKEIDELIEKESIKIQEEMAIYLKIWESETFIKKMHQLASLVNGEDYDWHFKIKTYNCKSKAGQSKNFLITQFIKKFQPMIPELSKSLSKCYRSQIRNAIAHSQYTTIGRTIILNNYDGNKGYSLQSISFDDWIDLFHESVILFSCYRKLTIQVNEMYYNAALGNNNSFQIRENRLHPNKEVLYYTLYTRDHFKDWSFYEDE